jgi:hypothetical protein
VSPLSLEICGFFPFALSFFLQQNEDSVELCHDWLNLFIEPVREGKKEQKPINITDKQKETDFSFRYDLFPESFSWLSCVIRSGKPTMFLEQNKKGILEQ